MKKCTGLLTGLLLVLTTAATAAEGTIDLLPNPGGSQGLVIDTPGSYVLVDNVTMTDWTATCILVTADNITINLNGHTISGAGEISPGISSGITQAPGKRNLTVRNGYIKNFPGTLEGAGVRAQGTGVVLEDLNITGCGTGIVLSGPDHRVENCVVSDCSIGIGMFGNRIEVRNCRVLNSTAQAIELSNTSGCRVEGNYCSGNDGPGIFLNGGGNSNWIINNTLTNNLRGISSGGGGDYIGNKASGNTDANYSGVPAALIVSLGAATAPPPATANVQP